MFKNLSIRKRIMVILVIVYVVSLSIAVTGGYFIFKRDTIRESEEKAEVFLATMKATRTYLKDILRPRLQELLPGQFVIEGMSSTFVSLNVARIARKTHPDYIYRVSSPNPLNPDNLSDEFENKVISSFKKGKKQWKGFVQKKGKRFYAVGLPVVAEKKCLKCHGSVEQALEAIKGRYGTNSGYGYKVGEVVGGIFVYVPAEVPLRQAFKKLLYFTGGSVVFFLAVLLVIDRIIVRSVVRPIENFVSVADEISRGKMDREFEVHTNDEMKTLAEAFTRMKISLAKAMDILKKR